jgi:hypothetical protein
MSDPHERALVILGDYRHFTGSLLAKLAGRAFEPLPVTAWHDDGRDTAFINWTPEMHRPVSDAERALVPRRARIINDTHFNSDKRNVQAHMHRVFGYRRPAFLLRPRRHQIEPQRPPRRPGGAVSARPPGSRRRGLRAAHPQPV